MSSNSSYGFLHQVYYIVDLPSGALIIMSRFFVLPGPIANNFVQQIGWPAFVQSLMWFYLKLCIFVPSAAPPHLEETPGKEMPGKETPGKDPPGQCREGSTRMRCGAVQRRGSKCEEEGALKGGPYREQKKWMINPMWAIFVMKKGQQNFPKLLDLFCPEGGWLQRAKKLKD